MATKISAAYLKRQQAAGKIRGFVDKGATVSPVVAQKQAWKTKGVDHIRAVLTRMGIAYDTEYRFDEERRFRLDFVTILMCADGSTKSVAIEYEGISSRKSRHTTKTGFATDAIKYNMAQMKGWLVLRYTSKTLANFEEDLKQLMQ